MAELDPLPPLPVHPRTRDGVLAEMIERLGGSSLPELAGFTSRDPADPALALLDGWATVTDVLSFYLERLAPEGYLDTAGELRSLVELARLAGYRPRPGLAASAWLAYQVDPDPADADVAIPAGAAVQSVPVPGDSVPPGPPAIFETSNTLTARREWNAMPGLAWRPMLLDTLDARCRGEFYLSGINLGIGVNDRLLVHFRVLDGGRPSAPDPRRRVVAGVTEDPVAARTTLALTAGNCGGFAAAHAGFDRLDVLRVRAAPFGATAPLRLVATPPPVIGLAAAPDPAAPAAAAPEAEAALVAGVPGMDAEEWDADLDLYEANNEGRRALVLPLDAEYPRIRAGSHIVVERRGAAPQVIRVDLVWTQAIARYGITGRVTVLRLAEPWFEFGDEPSLTELREFTIYAQAEELIVADEPITTPVAGDTVDVAADTTVPAGRSMVLTGAPGPDAAPDQPGGEVITVIVSERWATGGVGGGTYTSLLLSQPLTGQYEPASVVVFGNAVHATHGETKNEPAIGSGDTSQVGQSFVLHQQPLTYVASDGPSGARAELTIEVGPVIWHEVPELVRCGPREHAYQLLTSETGEVRVLFGDGVHGARLPTGSANVTARYRTGIGPAGNLRADRLTQMLTRPLGVTSVSNPLPSAGGTGPDDDQDIRTRAPLGLTAPDRLVGLGDYEDFCLARGGIGRASAALIPVAGREVAQISLAGPDGAGLTADSDAVTALAAAVQEYGDPSLSTEVAPATLRYLVLEASIGLAADRSWELTLPLLLAALEAALGAAARRIAQDCALAEVIAVLHGVYGVVSVDPLRFGAAAGPAPEDADAVAGVAEIVRAGRAQARPGAGQTPGPLTVPADLLSLPASWERFAVLTPAPPGPGEEIGHG